MPSSREIFQPTIQPTICDVLCDLQVFWQSPRFLLVVVKPNRVTLIRARSVVQVHPGPPISTSYLWALKNRNPQFYCDLCATALNAVTYFPCAAWQWRCCLIFSGRVLPMCPVQCVTYVSGRSLGLCGYVDFSAWQILTHRAICQLFANSLEQFGVMGCAKYLPLIRLTSGSAQNWRPRS